MERETIGGCMKSYKIDISDDAAGMLDEMRRFHRVEPENVMRIIVECGLADALDDRCLHAVYVNSARHPEPTTRNAWRYAMRAAADTVRHLVKA